MKKKFFMILLIIFMLPITVHAEEECTEHDFQPGGKAPTCDGSGWNGNVCAVCGQVNNFSILQPLGHLYGEWFTVEEATCSEEGLMRRICDRCGSSEEMPIEKTEHTCTVRVYEPTCGRDGYTLHTCNDCGYETRTDKVEKLGHNYIVTVIEPTCTADGYTRHKCANCGDAYRTDHQEKTGHLYDGGVLTKEPTLTAMGRITYTCQYCGDTYLETTPKWVNPFVDLNKNRYDYTPILWACNSGITNGISPTQFSPDGPCTRAQVVTFLWRSAGSPEPSTEECPFLDIKPGSYYELAVLWAVEQGITNGMDPTHFVPDSTCTRAQIVTFLYRAKGTPAHSGKELFRDVDTGHYFYDAVCWASENGITNGNGGTSFSPDLSCTRGQAVTFLYRARTIPNQN